MSKKDIKAKRWERKRNQLEVRMRRFFERTGNPLMNDLYERVCSGSLSRLPREEPLRFYEQRRVMGDGRIQYREAVQLRSFGRKLSLKRLRRAMNRSEWRDC